jgi:hypothetical protein
MLEPVRRDSSFAEKRESHPARLLIVRLESALLAAATVTLAASCLGVGVAGTMAEVLAWSVLGGIGNGAYGMAFVTALQERTGNRFQTCVGALYETPGSVVRGSSR